MLYLFLLKILSCTSTPPPFMWPRGQNLIWKYTWRWTKGNSNTHSNLPYEWRWKMRKSRVEFAVVNVGASFAKSEDTRAHFSHSLGSSKILPTCIASLHTPPWPHWSATSTRCREPRSGVFAPHCPPVAASWCASKTSQTRGRKCPRSFGILWFARSRYESEETSPTTTYFATLPKKTTSKRQGELIDHFTLFSSMWIRVRSCYTSHGSSFATATQHRVCNIIWWLVFLFFGFRWSNLDLQICISTPVMKHQQKRKLKIGPPLIFVRVVRSACSLAPSLITSVLPIVFTIECAIVKKNWKRYPTSLNTCLPDVGFFILP